MDTINIIERFRIWHNVYKRVSFFRKMYPFSMLIKDAFLLPVDYFSGRSFIRTIRNITIAVTHRCNIRCQMCYFHKELNTARDLSLSSFRLIIDSVKRFRPCVILTGGEPLLHPDLIDMVRYAKKSGLRIQIFTNGTALTPDLADGLIKAGLDYINFTLLGDKESHSDLARSLGAYEKFVCNLEYFAAHRNHTMVILNFTITPQAIKDAGHAMDLAKRYKLDGLRIQHYNFLLPLEFKAQGEVIKNLFAADSNTHEIEQTGQAVLNMAGALIEFMKKISRDMPDIPVQWAPTLTDSEIRNWYSGDVFKARRKCLYPWRGIFIDASGQIYPCPKIYLGLGNAQKDGVLDSWNGNQMNIVRRYLRKGLFPACARCCKL